MADILNTGISGLRASQRGLSTTSHNISNVNTDGFSRQRVEQDTTTPRYFARGAIGTGAQIQTIQRLSEESRVEALRRNHAEFERLDNLREMVARVDDLVADKDAGLSPALRQFFDAVEEVANDPSNTVTRQLMLTRGQALVDRFGTMDNRLSELEHDVERRVAQKTEHVNALGESIAELNNEIRRRWHNPQRPPNDLLDQRDEKIRQLSELVAVRVIGQDDGSLNVSVGTGQPLVTGDRHNDLKVVGNPYDGARAELAMQIGDREVRVTDRIRGGSLGGLIEFRDGVLDKTRDEIGRVATALATELNTQHRRGVQFDSGEPRPGRDFFQVGKVQVQSHRDNRGSAVPQVTIDDDNVSQLKRENYELRYDGSREQWHLRADSGQRWVLGEDVQADADGRYRLNGLQIEVPSPRQAALLGETAEDGDRFRIEPTRAGASGIDTLLSRPAQVAAAAPALTGEAVSAEGQSSNTGRGRIGPPEVGDMAGVLRALEDDGPLRRGIFLEYTVNPDGERYFQLYVGDEPVPNARFPYNPDDPERGQEIDLSEKVNSEYVHFPGVDGEGRQEMARLLGGGSSGDESERLRLLSEDLPAELDVTVRISGAPDPGDRFQITGNYDGIGDNTNALRMAELMDQSLMDDGNSTFQEAYSAMVGDIGAYSQRIQTNRDAQQTLLRQAEEHWEELSGVNLDEEAANMMEYQQAYQAAAQIIASADQVFQELLNSVRR
ncbi:flagellar hook-associated protein FlgK [Halorhodospira abdelmalekii]|uniref:flagellar hook-associated protein FlgK n=1 Tax=Halorhodospira abdelmalekii TaxID=421629 RepID=UPI00190752DE|nr:flagellar hook-associated protein FlgK [Halorhodospira abdelmalekii]MBK1734841.1 flagellar hook-associated protein FlgK [Halorhodospira abdelmalekii]